ALVKQRQRFLAVIRGFDHVTVEVEHHLYGIADEWLVVHHQDVSFWESWHAHRSKSFTAERSAELELGAPLRCPQSMRYYQSSKIPLPESYACSYKIASFC